MLGARVAITRDDGLTIWRRARADGSYASANDPRVLAGLGRSSKPVRVRVIWPGGASEEWSDVPVDRYTTLERRHRPVSSGGSDAAHVQTPSACVPACGRDC